MKKKDFLSYPSLPIKWELKSPGKKAILLEFIWQKKDPPLKEYPFFLGKREEILTLPEKWYIGLGKEEDIDEEALGKVFLNLFQKVVYSLEEIGFLFPDSLWEKFEQEMVVNFLLRALSNAYYSTSLLKKERESPSLKKVYLPPYWRSYLHKEEPILKHIQAHRQVQNLPSNYIDPESILIRAKEIARKYKLKLKVFRKKELEKMGAGGILGVSQGSSKEPSMILLEYKPPRYKETIAFVGKGVTFDTGGISLKPSADMHEMKFDL